MLQPVAQSRISGSVQGVFMGNQRLLDCTIPDGIKRKLKLVQ
jgi:hypothetical protein